MNLEHFVPESKGTQRMMNVCQKGKKTSLMSPTVQIGGNMSLKHILTIMD